MFVCWENKKNYKLICILALQQRLVNSIGVLYKQVIVGQTIKKFAIFIRSNHCSCYSDALSTNLCFVCNFLCKTLFYTSFITFNGYLFNEIEISKEKVVRNDVQQLYRVSLRFGSSEAKRNISS